MPDAIIRVQLMAKKGGPAQSYIVFAGNTVLLAFTVTDENDQPIDLTDWSVTYKLRPATGGDIWTGGKPVAIDGNQSDLEAGRCSLLLAASDTSPLGGPYNHFLVISDAASPANVGTFMTGTATFTTGGV